MPAHVGVGGDDRERGRGEEVLGDAAPQVPDRLDRGVLLALDERLGVDAGELAQLAQEVGGREEPDRRLQVGPVQLLAELAAELAVHADIDVRIREPGRCPR